MYNDFVLIGPKSDPAKVAGGKDIVEALKKVQATQAPFVSRGDKSGTHMAELDLWKASGVDLEKAKGAVVSRHRAGDGAGAQHGGVDERVRARRSRPPGSPSRIAATSRSSSKATSGSSTSTA